MLWQPTADHITAGSLAQGWFAEVLAASPGLWLWRVWRNPASWYEWSDVRAGYAPSIDHAKRHCERLLGGKR